MKFAFSTLGVPGTPVRDAVRLAVEHGYDGVELRAHPEEAVHPGIGAAERAAVAEEFAAAGVAVLAVAGYARVAAPGDDEPVLSELSGLTRLAEDVGASYVRVFPGGGDEQSPEEADATAARRLGAAAPEAADRGVRLLLETHDSHPRGADAARVLGPVGHKNVGALWDVMHPWLAGESPTATFPALSPHLGYVQVKDVASAEDTTPLALGAGVLPLSQVVGLLGAEGWDGWLCWEYEKRWYPRAEPLEGLLGPGREHLQRLVEAAPDSTR
ncbi:sugar phosphate isomerase/epimerase family protein [Streptomyces sp. NPDC050617]|uniref:sugar phosphate isomerase/epimerase family protein n=1 Tax=Streptomyces sp. NPDC050617 TaxID=3154628 RepID=UPI0034390F03